MSILHAIFAFALGVGSVEHPSDIATSAYLADSENVEIRVNTQTTRTGAAGFEPWLQEFRKRAKRAGVSRPTLDQALANLRYDPSIIKLDRRQSDFTRTIAQYLDKAVTRDRIAGGQRALKKYATALNQIERRYKVDKEVVVAIWGLETSYGGFVGNSSTIRSLATLAYDGRRSAFFENELIEALNILENNDVTLKQMVGSWAGAMGHTQFMPSSYNAHAVDFDGDGQRNIWSKDPTDALASTAAYLKNSGWKPRQRWAVEVQLPAGFDLRYSNPGLRKSPKEWQRLGLTTRDTRAFKSMKKAELFLPAGADGPALLIAQNFEAIRKYNLTPTYIMAVGLLSDTLAGRPSRFDAPWPKDARLLSLAERKDMQARLRAAGFDPKRYDGKLDGTVIRAVQAYQRAKGLRPDGNPSAALLDQLHRAP